MILEIVLIILFISLNLILPVLIVLIIFSSIYSDIKGAPFVPNSNDVIRKALSLAGANNKDILLDLGSGNGKVLKIGIKEFGVKKAIGYEISPWPYLLGYINLRKYISSSRAHIYRKDIFQADLSNAMLIYVYLFPKLLDKLTEKLSQAKKSNPNLRIVSPVFEIKSLKLIKKIRTYHKGFKKNINIYLY